MKERKVYILQKELPDEIVFKRYPNSDYYVSIKGEVFSFQSKKLLKPYKGGEYLWYSLWIDSNPLRKSMHVLIAEMFIPNPKKLPIVRHLNDNPNDNSLQNLAWGTKSDNMNDAVRNGLIKNRPSPQGIKHAKAKLNDEKVIQMRKDFNNGIHYKDLAIKYGIAGTYVYDICKHRRWKHVS